MGKAAVSGDIHTAVGHLGPGARIAAEPEVIYEIRPNLRGVYDGRRFRSDRYGFRQDRDVRPEKGPGVTRLVGIGDSWMWGTGVDNGETYLDRLSEGVARDGFRVEVVNMGVWGYNARQEVATLRTKALAFSPDVVVIGLCGNDREYPYFLRSESFADLGHSFLWGAVRRSLARLAGDASFDGVSMQPMPFSDFLSAYAELAALAERAGFAVVVFSECFSSAAPDIQDPTCQLGSADEWRRFVTALRSWGFHLCAWDIGAIPQNPRPHGHATREGNRLLAARLGECVEPLLSR